MLIKVVCETRDVGALVLVLFKRSQHKHVEPAPQLILLSSSSKESKGIRLIYTCKLAPFFHRNVIRTTVFYSRSEQAIPASVKARLVRAE